MIRNLGTALTILARAEAAEHFMHADVDAFGAPSECHGLVSRNEARRLRQARKHAEAEAKAPYRVIRAQAQKRGRIVPCSGDPRWQRLVGRIYTNTYPF